MPVKVKQINETMILFMSYMCINNKLLSKHNISLIVFLPVSIYFNICIAARGHFRCHVVNVREFG